MVIRKLWPFVSIQRLHCQIIAQLFYKLPFSNNVNEKFLRIWDREKWLASSWIRWLGNGCSRYRLTFLSNCWSVPSCWKHLLFLRFLWITFNNRGNRLCKNSDKWCIQSTRQQVNLILPPTFQTTIMLTLNCCWCLYHAKYCY